MPKKKKTARERELAIKIKLMEQKKREEQLVQMAEEKAPKEISFDQWWMLVNRKITIPHYVKEIIRVDFKARGLKDKELEAKFDKALELFGYKI